MLVFDFIQFCGSNLLKFVRVSCDRKLFLWLENK